MEASDSDSSEVGLERCSSVKSIQEVFDVVPDEKEYKFKIFTSGPSNKGTRLVFPLKKGKVLPYDTKTITKKGRCFEISFSKTLVPSINGFEAKQCDDWWEFTEGCFYQ